MNKPAGFTITELMITLFIASVLATIAVPSYDLLITRNRLVSELNQFVATLHLARSEAIKRGLPVRACTSSDGATCATTGDWDQGWIVRVDGPNTVLKIHPALTGGDTFRGDAKTSNAVRFDRNGLAVGFDGLIALCDSDADLSRARALVISPTGRVQSQNTGTCTP
jgi:type IV fimbrial biogenesis protein FimT